MSTPAISIRNFTKRYGKVSAVDDLSIDVPKGSIFGLLGQNGAGKTTTIRTMLNLLQPTSGTIEVLGLDSVRESLDIRKRIGYLPEEPSYYPWMTVDEIIWFNAAFYPTWDDDLADRLLDDLGLPRDRKLGKLSRGMQAKVGLVMALGQRPELLILDDPTAGLDPVVRQEFLEAMIANVQAEGGTVFFSTHLLHEMERVADELAMIHDGRLRLRGSLEQIKLDFKKLRVVYPNVVPRTFPLSGIVRAEVNHHQALLTVSKYDPSMDDALLGTGAESVDVLDLSLEEIFVETVKGERVIDAASRGKKGG
jgi:ABC-2 type transport system ATP-binding protein